MHGNSAFATRLRLARWLPAAGWLRRYDRATLGHDLVAALIVTLMLVPQSLAYAMLAGLPPQVGLYASIAPLVAYAAFGSSRTLSVGPVAVVSLMTAAATATSPWPAVPVTSRPRWCWRCCRASSCWAWRRCGSDSSPHS